MAESQPDQTTEPLAQKDGGEKRLKYLGFVRILVIYSVVCLSTIYKYARENSGRLKSSVQTAENIVTNVVGPIYDKLQDVPFEVLVFLDIKVGEALAGLNRHVPTLMKQVSVHVKHAGQTLPGVTRYVASESFKRVTKVTNTLYVKYEPTAKELYKTYGPVAEKYAVSTWRSMHKLPLFPQVAQIAVPTVAFLLEKYNCVVCYTAERGYVVSHYLPLVPIDKIAEVFAEDQSGSTAGQSVQVET